ncbi:MAG: cell division protein ZapE [Gammaproteobacteria bacterium]
MPLSKPGVLAGYLDDLRERGYDDDPDQRQIASALDDVRVALAKTQSTSSHWPFSRRRKVDPVKGLYIHGDVGRGKTYLMDMFYDRLVERRKLRQHFHRFMQRVHHDLNQLKHQTDPLTIVAADLAERYRVICFDEFFVSDIADAMLLGGLFTQMFRRGVTLIATSNVAPDDLYRDGLQRSRFLPAIDQLNAHCRVISTSGANDYRLRLLASTDSYRHPLSAATHQALAESFDLLAPGPGSGPGEINIHHRPIPFVRRANGIAWFDFDALCRGPRGVADYIEIARTFKTILLSGVPTLDATLENESRRFIALVDEFYDQGINLLMSANEPVDQLYQGSKLTFEFRRTQSRLREMQSTEYLARPRDFRATTTKTTESDPSITARSP